MIRMEDGQHVNTAVCVSMYIYPLFINYQHFLWGSFNTYIPFCDAICFSENTWLVVVFVQLLFFYFRSLYVCMCLICFWSQCVHVCWFVSSILQKLTVVFLSYFIVWCWFSHNCNNIKSQKSHSNYLLIHLTYQDFAVRGNLQCIQLILWQKVIILTVQICHHWKQRTINA